MKRFLPIILLISNLAYAVPTILEVKYKNITVNNKTVKVYTIEQPDGTWGYYGKYGQDFDVIVKNKLNESTVIHWHGLLLPNNQDGTSLTQAYIPPGGEYHYNFKLKQAGTYWMHSHYGLQEQDFAEAPLIIESAVDKQYQQVVVMFQDFSFTSPQKILANLKHPESDSAMSMMNMSNMQMNMSKPDLNDVKYDAFLTNYHTLDNPQVIQVKPGDKVKLRFINGGAMSNFWINLGKLNGTLIAVDGNQIKPIFGHLFQLALAQRMDIIVTIPNRPGVFPILGQVEGTQSQTGLILTSKSDKMVDKFSNQANQVLPGLNYAQELKLHSQEPLPKRKIGQVVDVVLDGNMQNYVWTINNQVWPKVTPLIVKKGERIEMVFKNNTMMAHPMHLHGNIFQIESINGKVINDGAMRDTVLVMPHSTVKVIFDANEPGKWALHCHMLYHMHSGMMTFLETKE